jgi:hypothetical protein
LNSLAIRASSLIFFSLSSAMFINSDPHYCRDDCHTTYWKYFLKT